MVPSRDAVATFRPARSGTAGEGVPGVSGLGEANTAPCLRQQRRNRSRRQRCVTEMTTTDVARTGTAAVMMASGTQTAIGENGLATAVYLKGAELPRFEPHTYGSAPASVSPPNSTDGIGVSNVHFVVNNNAQQSLQSIADPVPQTRTVPQKIVLLKGPAWIALMTLDEKAEAEAEGTKSNCGDGVVDDAGLVGKLIILKRVVLQAKIKPRTQRSSNGNGNANYVARSDNERALIRDLSGNYQKPCLAKDVGCKLSAPDAQADGPAAAALEAAKNFWEACRGSDHQGTRAADVLLDQVCFQKNNRRKKDASGEDSNNVRASYFGDEGPRADADCFEEVQKMSYNNELQLHLPEQSNNKRRARRRGPRSRSSGYRGVTCYRRTGRWEAHIWEERRQIHLGSFATPEDAARSYDRAALRFRGLDADLNFDIKNYRNDIWLKNGAGLSNEDFVKLLRSHDRIRCSAKNEDGMMSENLSQEDYEKIMRGFIVKSIKRSGLPEYGATKSRQASGQKGMKSQTKGARATGKVNSGSKRQKTTPTKDPLIGDVVLHHNPNPHAFAHYPVSYAPPGAAVDHGGAMLVGMNHFHPSETAMAMPVQNVPMMHFWNVGQLDDHGTNGNIEFLAVAGDNGHDDHTIQNGLNMSDMSPELVFNVVDKNGVPHSSNNSPISHSGRAGGMPHAVEYANRHA